MSDEEDLLDIFLSTAVEENDEPTSKKETALKEIDIFKGETIEDVQKHLKTDKKSALHGGDTDSSDDEDNRNISERLYNDSGRDIKRLLSDNQPHTKPINGFNGPRERISWRSKSPDKRKPITRSQKLPEKFDVFIDPVFGLRIVNPLISSAVLQERMMGRDAVQFSQLNNYLQRRTSDKDWVLAGVLVSKSAVKTSQKGKKFLIWTLSDLKDDIKTVSVFLFGSAYNQLWKTQVGVVVGLLNPNVLDKKEGSRDIACLSIDNHQKAMMFGTSKDFGTCRSVKKNGEKCNAIVNINRCEFCLYHIKQEYQKCSQRSDLQTHFVGKGLVALRNKVLGKNEVFYAGKSYMAIPAKKSKKLEQKDNNRLDRLNGLSGFSNNIVKAKNRGPTKKKQNAARLDVSHAQRLRDMELLRKLSGASDIESKTNFSGNHSSEVLSLEESKNLALNVINKLKSKNPEAPKLTAQTKYDSRSDLIVNVDNKNNFGGKISENVTLDESRNLAKNVIAKLKEKKENNVEKIETKNDTVVDEEIENICGNDLLGDDDFDLDYDDLDDLSVEKTKEDKIISDVNSIETRKENGNLQVSKSSSKIDISPKTNNKSTKSTNSSKKENPSPIVSTKPPSNKILSPKQSSGSLNGTTTENKKLQGGNDIFPPKSTTNILSNNLKSTLKSLETNPKLSLSAPTLSRFGSSRGFIDLNEPLRRKTMDKAKLNAIKLVQATGPIKKIDPNSTKSSPSTGIKKRFLPDTDVEELNPKKSKLAESDLISDRFKKMMAATSRHTDLLEQRDDEEMEKYFKKHEMKEKMEEKMTNTFKIACKAVRCLKCKYTSFSASDMCKKEGHPLKVFDSMKRFFKCGNCQNRTVTLEIVPTVPCKNCGSGKWEKTGMMKEKVVGVAHQLSIRGGEQKFVNSVVADANINLLVPDE